VGSEARRQFTFALAKRELRLHHYAVLMALAELGVTSQQRLGAMIGVDPRNLVGTIDALERRGLLRRAPDPSDRRRHAVTLTGEGQALLRQLRRDRERVERGFLSPLDRSEQAALHRLLLRLLAARCGQPDDSD
jgi:DNA-binding MarR family transcriptional regulator